jgi:hypothetical protein
MKFNGLYNYQIFILLSSTNAFDRLMNGEGGQLGKTYIALISDTISQKMKCQIVLFYTNL